MEQFEQSDIIQDNSNTSLLSKLAALIGVVILLAIVTGGYFYYQMLQEINSSNNDTFITQMDLEEGNIEAPTGKLYITVQNANTKKWHSIVFDVDLARADHFQDLYGEGHEEPLHISFSDTDKAAFITYTNEGEDTMVNIFIADISEKDAPFPKMTNFIRLSRGINEEVQFLKISKDGRMIVMSSIDTDESHDDFGEEVFYTLDIELQTPPQKIILTKKEIAQLKASITQSIDNIYIARLTSLIDSGARVELFKDDIKIPVSFTITDARSVFISAWRE